MVFPVEGQRARMLGDRSFEVWHSGESIPASDTVNLAIPSAAPKAVIEPLDGRTRQPPLVATQEIHHLLFQGAVITLAVEHAGAGGRVEATVETPQNFVDRVSAIEEVKKVAKDFAATAINCDRVAEHAARRFLGFRAIMKNAGIRSEEHTSELQSPCNLVCRLLL